MTNTFSYLLLFSIYYRFPLFLSFSSFFLSFVFVFFYFTILYWLCHTSTWICHGWIHDSKHGCTRVSHPEPLFHLPPHTVPLGHPSAPDPSILYHASNLDWQSISHMIIYMFQCHSPKSSNPRPLPQSPKDCSIHLCLFCFKRGGESFGRMALKHV